MVYKHAKAKKIEFVKKGEFRFPHNPHPGKTVEEFRAGRIKCVSLGGGGHGVWLPRGA